MRHIGNLPDETQARVFGDFLLANGIHNNVEREDAAAWAVWVVEEDRITQAQSWLEKFRSNPTAPEFQGAQSEAAKRRQAEADDLANYRKRVRTSRSLFPGFGRHGFGPVTYVLIFCCVVVATYSQLGENQEFLRNLYIADPDNPSTSFLSVILSREMWRLITPIFIHFGLIHLLFNMLWLFQLGCMIEASRSSLYLLLLVVITGLISNVAQLYFAHTIRFGGMSGVVYALAGFVWMQGKYNRAAGMALHPQSVMIMLIWLVVCYTGAVGPIANTAHLVGLITGVVWGRLSAWMFWRRPE
jgi:GlpG protein